MKNIHILPTDKPRFDKYLVLNKESKICIWDTKVMGSQTTLHTQNIYITSDEKIKEGDWVIYLNKPSKVETSVTIEYAKTYCKKIILTTDQNLIKDGVQPIDDEFLQWFVKNPNCDEVEVDILWNDDENFTHDSYKIIIPKEETTAYHYLSCCRSIEECHCGKYPKRGITITHVGKQETLEEAAKRLYPINIVVDYDTNEEIRNIWIKGAKWQQERMYSEIEVDKLISDFKHDLRESTSSYIKQSCAGAIFGLTKLKNYKRNKI